MFPRLTFLCLLLGFAGAARATTVEPPSFPELVAGAEAVYRGHVTRVEAKHVARPDAGGTMIKTYVTFAIERTLKGTAQPDIVLEFLGGRVGDDILEVSGVPQFTLGDREFLFVQGNGRQFCPLVGVMHGRYRIAHDATTARDYVARENYQPLRTVDDVSHPLADRAVPRVLMAAAIAGALSPDDFESQIRHEVLTPSAISPGR